MSPHHNRNARRLRTFSVKAGALLTAALIAQGAAQASILMTFDEDTLGGLPQGYRYINNPANTRIEVIDTRSGNPFPAGNVQSLLLTDQSSGSQPIIAFKDTVNHMHGVASFDFSLTYQTAGFNKSSLLLRLGNGGTNGNITTADAIAAQVRLSTSMVDGNAVGQVLVSDVTGALVTLDQTFSLNTAYSLEVEFSNAEGSGNGSFLLYLTELGGSKVALTAGGGTVSSFDFRGGTLPAFVNTIWLQSGDTSNIASQAAIDNIRLIPEGSSIVLFGTMGASLLGWSYFSKRK